MEIGNERTKVVWRNLQVVIITQFLIIWDENNDCFYVFCKYNKTLHMDTILYAFTIVAPLNYMVKLYLS